MLLIWMLCSMHVVMSFYSSILPLGNRILQEPHLCSQFIFLPHLGGGGGSTLCDEQDRISKNRFPVKWILTQVALTLLDMSFKGGRRTLRLSLPQKFSIIMVLSYSYIHRLATIHP